MIFGVNDLFNERLLVSLEEVVVHIDIDDCCSVFASDDSLLNDKKNNGIKLKGVSIRLVEKYL